jgi:hypothetical protein
MLYFGKTKFIYVICIFIYSCKENIANNCSPIVNYNNDTINIGNIKKGDSVNIIFKLKNIGDCDFHIKKIGVGCGCTEVKFDSTIIKPNQSSLISLKYRNKEDSGGFIKAIVVESNSSPTLHTLFVKGKGD